MTKSNRVSTTVSATFVKGRNYGRNYQKSGAEAADTLRVDDIDIQHKAKSELKAGMIAAYLWPTVDVTEGLVAQAEAVITKAGKLRTTDEARAEHAARSAISRLFARYRITNLEPKGGSNRGSKKVKVKADSWVGDKGRAVPLAAYATPVIATPADLATHLSFVVKGLASALTKAKNVMPAKQFASYRKAVATFQTAIEKIALPPARINKKPGTTRLGKEINIYG